MRSCHDDSHPVQHTGSPAPRELAYKIANIEVCPVSRESWNPSIKERLANRRTLQEGGKRSRNACDNDSGPGGAGELPGVDADFHTWTVTQLREFLTVSGCTASVL